MPVSSRSPAPSLFASPLGRPPCLIDAPAQIHLSLSSTLVQPQPQARPRHAANPGRLRPSQASSGQPQLARANLEPVSPTPVSTRTWVDQFASNPCQTLPLFLVDGCFVRSYQLVATNFSVTYELTKLNSEFRSSWYELSKLLGLIVKHSFQCLNYIVNSLINCVSYNYAFKTGK